MANKKTRGQIPHRGQKGKKNLSPTSAKAGSRDDDRDKSAILGNPPQQRQEFNPNVNSAKIRFQHQNRG